MEQIIHTAVQQVAEGCCQHCRVQEKADVRVTAARNLPLQKHRHRHDPAHDDASSTDTTQQEDFTAKPQKMSAQCQHHGP